MATKTSGRQPAYPVPADAVSKGQTIAQRAAFELTGDMLAGPFGADILNTRSREVMEFAADAAIDFYEVVQERLVARGYA